MKRLMHWKSFVSASLLSHILIAHVIDTVIKSNHLREAMKGIMPDGTPVKQAYAEVLNQIIRYHLEKVEPEGLSWEALG